MPARPTELSRLSDQRLLAMRLRDVAPSCSLESAPIARALQRLDRDLTASGLRFRPRVWISDHFFAKDGLPGFAVPFYLAHPRLTRLEATMMLDVEGGTDGWLLRILRHETGHAIDTAFRLHRRAAYRAAFGDYAVPYPDFYRPRPASRDFVLHLDSWYAQSHPAEDFAETFAVWLNPESRWREVYAGWNAMAKLRCVDELMAAAAGRAAPVRKAGTHRPLHTLDETLGSLYARRRAEALSEGPAVPDRDLLRAFREPGGARSSRDAATFVRERSAALRPVLARWTGEPALRIEKLLADVIQRCAALGLRLRRSSRETEQDLLAMLCYHTMNYLHDARHKIAL